MLVCFVYVSGATEEKFKQTASKEKENRKSPEKKCWNIQKHESRNKSNLVCLCWWKGLDLHHINRKNKGCVMEMCLFL